jgi:hypothetical protein
MRRVVAVLAALVAALPARTECVATAHREGSEIPQYVVLEKQSLAALWSGYAQSYPQSARLSDEPAAYGVRELADQCLVRVASADGSGDEGSEQHEQLVVQRPCDQLVIGSTHRLVITGYCVEQFGGPPDFYSTLRYRHAEITLKDRF